MYGKDDDDDDDGSWRIVWFCSSQERSKPGKPHRGGCRSRIRNGNRTCGSLGPQEAGEQSALAPVMCFSRKNENISIGICFLSMLLQPHQRRRVQWS